MAIIDNKIDNLRSEQQRLIRILDQSTENEDGILKELEVINQKIESRVRDLIAESAIRDEKIEVKGERTMEEEQEVQVVPDMEQEEKPKRIGKKPKKDSYTMIIVDVLSRKYIKNLADAVAKVDEIKPGRARNKIEKHIKAIIYLVKKQRGGRWQKYVWDDENFLLFERE